MPRRHRVFLSNLLAASLPLAAVLFLAAGTSAFGQTIEVPYSGSYTL